MKIVAVVQARVRSTRLPAKILLDLAGAPALERCLRRVARFEGLAEVVVATSTEPADEIIAATSERLGFRAVRGSEQDVLGRYLLAAEATQADVLVRCTSDCPFLDPVASSRVIGAFVRAQTEVPPVAYASNTLDRRMPRGLDTEVVTVAALREAAESDDPLDHEHVTRFVHRHPERFRLLSVVDDAAPDRSDLRWTLDTLDDYRLLHALATRLGASADTASTDDIARLIEREPSLAQLNAHVRQKVE